MYINQYLVQESCGDAVLTVYRENGADGDIDVSFN